MYGICVGAEVILIGIGLVQVLGHAILFEILEGAPSEIPNDSECLIAFYDLYKCSHLDVPAQFGEIDSLFASSFVDIW